MDDLAVEGDDDDLLGADLDDGGDVLVGLVFGDGDALAEQVDPAVGSDVADDLDAALRWEPGRRPVGAGEGTVESAVPDLVRGRTGVGAVAVVGVVELDEGGVLGAEVLDAVA